jgi:hypothetical protein
MCCEPGRRDICSGVGLVIALRDARVQSAALWVLWVWQESVALPLALGTHGEQAGQRIAGGGHQAIGSVCAGRTAPWSPSLRRSCHLTGCLWREWQDASRPYRRYGRDARGGEKYSRARAGAGCNQGSSIAVLTSRQAGQGSFTPVASAGVFVPQQIPCCRTAAAARWERTNSSVA